MRDDDRVEATQLGDRAHGLVVEVGETVPEDVPAGGKTAEEGALADGEFGDGLDGDEGGGVGGGGGEGVGVFCWGGAQGAQGCPGLALGAG